VIAIGAMLDRDHTVRRGIRDVGVARYRESVDEDVALRSGVVHVEPPVGRVRRIERQAEKTALTAGDHTRGDVQKRRCERRAALHDANAAACSTTNSRGSFFGAVR
jgi:hypothetical protein